MTIKRKYGWFPDTPDQRDQTYRSVHHISPTIPLPESVNLRPYCPKVYDQGDVGSCTANAIVGAFEYDLLNRAGTFQSNTFSPLSRLFLYYNERDMEGTVNSDAGAFIRDGMKSINKVGVCTEELWPYIPSYYSSMPEEACYIDAESHTSVTLIFPASFEFLVNSHIRKSCN
jgi:C1A family cysteine protease